MPVRYLTILTLVLTLQIDNLKDFAAYSLLQTRNSTTSPIGASATVATPTTQRVISGTGGAVPDGMSVDPVLSASGDVVVFVSRARNLIAGETLDPLLDHWQVYAYDRATHTLERISVTPTGLPGNGSSGGSPPAVSADGRFVAFTSRASNLVPGDTNNAADIFVRDRQTATTQRVSIADSGAQGNRDSYLPAISGDGRFVAFISQATNLVPGDTNNLADVFIHDRQAQTTRRVSVSVTGVQANGSSGLAAPALSSEGRFVAFASHATNLVAGDTNGVADVFVYDRQSGGIERISMAHNGVQADGPSSSPTISGDGRYVAFLSSAQNLVSGAQNGHNHVYLRDRQSGQIERVSVGHDGNLANGPSYSPVISGDGRFIAFASAADNLVSGDTNGTLDIFLHDGLSGQIERVSIASNGGGENTQSPIQANGLAWRPTLGGYGRYVAFESTATNLTFDPMPGSPGLSHIYLRDRGPLATGSYTLAGQISGPANEPVAGLTLTIGRRFPRLAVTDGRGRFVVADLPPGSYVVDLDAPGYLIRPQFPLVVTVGDSSAQSPELVVQAYPCIAPSGLNLCALEPGHILAATSAPPADWLRVGGVYFTQVTLYLGMGDTGPEVIRFTPGSSTPQASISVGPLLEQPIWTGADVLDWAVIQPTPNASLARRAADFARSWAQNPQYVYGFFAADGVSPIPADSVTPTYDAKLIFQAYAQAGLNMPSAPVQRPAALSGWLLPDSLYTNGTQLQRRTSTNHTQPVLLWAEGPVRVALVGDNGVRLGFRPNLPAALPTIESPSNVAPASVVPGTISPPTYLYTGGDGLVESIIAPHLANDVTWHIEITGVTNGVYTLGLQRMVPHAPGSSPDVTIRQSSIRQGETQTQTLTQTLPRQYQLFLPDVGR